MSDEEIKETVQESNSNTGKCDLSINLNYEDEYYRVLHEKLALESQVIALKASIRALVNGLIPEKEIK